MSEIKNIVVIGGGHGTGVVLSSLADSGFDLCALVSMADDGGSTGRLRKELGVSAVGDIRQCLARLSTIPEAAELFSYRFEGGELDGHSLGNLFLANGERVSGSLIKSIEMAKKMLGVSTDILPVTEDKPYLHLNTDGKIIEGVHTIATSDFDGKSAEVYLKPESVICEAAENALKEADLIIIAPGNFYCSIMPALLVQGMRDAINFSKAKTVFIANLVNRYNQTDGYGVQDYIDELNRLTGGINIDATLYNTRPIPPQCLRDGEQVVRGDETSTTAYKTFARDIADSQPVPVAAADKIATIRSLVRHDQAALNQAITEIIKEL